MGWVGGNNLKNKPVCHKITQYNECGREKQILKMVFGSNANYYSIGLVRHVCLITNKN